ncbi:unnamed protein product [Linum trigynum]|uniref:Uncharacterized protein n=1 Tax=Linum trigynum TaxID=586398 RepID=A0AAV2CYW7_9ROSI
MLLTKSMTASKKVVQAKQAADSATARPGSGGETTETVNAPLKGAQNRSPPPASEPRVDGAVVDETEDDEVRVTLRRVVATLADERRARLEMSQKV